MKKPCDLPSHEAQDSIQKGPAQSSTDNVEAQGASNQAEKAPLFGRFSRRSFLSQLGAAGIAATTAPLAHATAAVAEPQTDGHGELIPGAVPLTLRVNGKDYHLMLEPRVALLDTLRERIALPGTKKGCDHGQCGACTV